MKKKMIAQKKEKGIDAIASLNIKIKKSWKILIARRRQVCNGNL